MAELTAMPAPEKKPLTPRELDTARIIQEFVTHEGRPPSLMELANELELKSRSGACKCVQALVAKGWAVREPNKRYSLRLLQPVPLAPELIAALDVKTVSAIALEAINELRRIMGDCGIALTLARRLEAALAEGGGTASFELTPAGEEACRETP